MEQPVRKKRAARMVFAVLAAAGMFAAGCVTRPYLDGLFDHGGKPAGAPTPAPSGEGWINLLDAANAPLWKYLGDDMDIFEVHDGVLVILGPRMEPRFGL